MRFRTKTILGIALIEMALLAVLISSVLSILRESNEAELTRRIEIAAKLLAAAAKNSVISQDLATLESLTADAISSGQIDRVRILDSTGNLMIEKGAAEFLARGFHHEASISEVTDGVFDWAAPIVAGGLPQGEVQISVSTDPLKVLLASARRWAGSIAALEMLLVAIFSWLLGSYLVRQLGAMRIATQRFSAGDFQHRVAVTGKDELAETAIAFNHMAQQLGESHNLLQSESLQRLKAQQQAEDRNEQLNAIFALSPDGFVSFDAKNRVKYASPAFFQLTGLSNAEIYGLNEQHFSACIAKITNPKQPFIGIAALRALQKINPEKLAQHQKIELSDGSKRTLEMGLRESQAKSASQIVYFRDVTHETKVDRMKSEFLETAAHELRTPMASIYGYVELMMAHQFSAEEQQEYLSTIYRNSELMIVIINELLDLARIEANRGKDFVIEPQNLAQVLTEITHAFVPPHGRIAPRLPAFDKEIAIQADKNKLTQAVLNVLSNAYKYSPQGGAVSMDLVANSARDIAQSYIGIKITDHGIGMNEEQQARIFERFYRADASGTILGTGLGMSIVHEIIELHAGHISVESQLGSGTTIILWLPKSSATAQPEQPHLNLNFQI